MCPSTRLRNYLRKCKKRVRIIVRIFLDTSYLLPIFRIEPNIKGYKDGIDLILNDKENGYYYSSLSLIEIKWKFIKLEKTKVKTDMQNNFNHFQNILLKDKRFELIHHANTNINMISDEIRNLGHKDYFDSLLGASSIWHCDIFVTEDTELKEKMNEVNKKGKYNREFIIYNWRELKKNIL